MKSANLLLGVRVDSAEDNDFHLKPLKSLDSAHTHVFSHVFVKI